MHQFKRTHREPFTEKEGRMNSRRQEGGAARGDGGALANLAGNAGGSTECSWRIPGRRRAYGVDRSDEHGQERGWTRS